MQQQEYIPQWDFVQTFPQPLPAAINAGVFGADVPDEAAVRAIHDEHARHLLSILSDLEAIADAKIDGTDPRTGRKPKGEAARQKLDRFLIQQRQWLENEQEALMQAYEDAFGDEPASEFETFLQNQMFDRFRSQQPIPLPIVPPLPEAIANGSFGMEEDDCTPVYPSDEEVEDLTQNCGERLVELIETLEEAEVELANGNGDDRGPLVREVDRARCAVQSAIAIYGEDFGEAAAEQLLGWANAQVGAPTLSERSPETMKTPCPPPPVPEKIPQTHTVDPARLQRGQWSQVFNRTVGEGDIAAAYCADAIAMHGRVASPFKFEGELWACTNLSGHGEAYRLVPLEHFTGTPTTYAEKSRDRDAARADPDGFYHGMKVQHRKQWFVLAGPPVRFVPGHAVNTAPAAKMEQMQLFAEMR